VKFTYSIHSRVSLHFEVTSPDETSAGVAGEDKFLVFLEKASKSQLADLIIDGMNSSENQVRKGK
jgi:hypothetical protein